MHWSDRAIVLGVRPLGETGVVLEALTRDHGRHLGLVHGGRSRHRRPLLQVGNTVSVEWRARLDEQLGTFSIEEGVSRAGRLIGSRAALSALGTMTSHLRLLAERDPHPDLFDAAEEVLDHLDDRTGPPRLALFELMVLADFGFGLDLSACAATGAVTDLVYVSPRSGRAVGRIAGEPHRARLLPLPRFLRDPEGGPPSEADIEDAFRLTGFFLVEHVYAPRGLSLPADRDRVFVATKR